MEQKNLFDHLPDGLLIHTNEPVNEAEGTEELSLRYLNQTFKKMFQGYQSVKNQETSLIDFNKIYLKKTRYKIFDQVVQ